MISMAILGEALRTVFLILLCLSLFFTFNHRLYRRNIGYVTMMVGFLLVAAVSVADLLRAGGIIGFDDDLLFIDLAYSFGAIVVIVGIWLVLPQLYLLKRTQKDLDESQAHFGTLLEQSSEGIWTIDFEQPLPFDERANADYPLLLQGVMSNCNAVLAKMYGANHREELLGRSVKQLLTRYGMDTITEGLAQLPESGQLLDFELRGQCRDSNAWFSLSISAAMDGGMITRIWGTQKNISERKAHLQALEHQALHDSLTALPNRYKLYAEVKGAIGLTKASNTRVALMLLDLNRFKDINDTLGHYAGDMILQAIGPRMEPLLQANGAMMARLGGDEFAILKTDIIEISEAEDLSFEVIRNLEQPFTLEDGLEVDIAGSIGISIYPDHAQDVSGMMRCADVAMYLAKHNQAHFKVYDAELDQNSPRKLALMSELGSAIRNRDLHLEYQPIIASKSGDLQVVECLVRWSHDRYGTIPPAQFVPVAENTELILPLTLWVLEEAIGQCVDWHKQGLKTSVAVNLSVRSLVDERFPDQVRRILDNHGLEPRYLELEITESAIMANPEQALIILNRISNIGVSLSIDDFGTGYSSLTYLQKLPIEKLKIDLSFVRKMMINRHDEMIVRSVTNLAHNMGLRVIAEGVEDEEVLFSLQRIGCDGLQGFFIGRPTSAEGLLQWSKQTTMNEMLNESNNKLHQFDLL